MISKTANGLPDQTEQYKQKVSDSTSLPDQRTGSDFFMADNEYCLMTIIMILLIILLIILT